MMLAIIEVYIKKHGKQGFLKLIHFRVLFVNTYINDVVEFPIH